MHEHADDLLILAGCGLLVYTTWTLSVVAAQYVTAVMLIVFGVLIGMGGKHSDHS